MESKSKSTEFGHNPQFKNKIFLIRSFLSKPNPSTSKCNSKSAKKQQIDKFIWNHSINQFWYRMPMAKLHQSLIVQACVLQFNVSKSSELILYIKRANKIKAINSLVFFGFWKVDLNQRYSLIFCCFDFWNMNSAHRETIRNILLSIANGHDVAHNMSIWIHHIHLLIIPSIFISLCAEFICAKINEKWWHIQFFAYSFPSSTFHFTVLKLIFISTKCNKKE